METGSWLSFLMYGLKRGKEKENIFLQMVWQCKSSQLGKSHLCVWLKYLKYYLSN